MYRKEQIEENLQRYHSLFYLNPDGVYSIDQIGNVTNINPALENLLGYSMEDYTNMTYHHVVDSDYLEITNDFFQKALHGVPQFYETVAIHKRGFPVPLHITNVPIIINGEINGVFGIAKDIAEEKKAFRLLEENEEKYRSLFDNNNDAVFELDVKGNYMDGNRMTEVLTGYTKDELHSMDISLLVVENVEEVRQDFVHARNGNAVHSEREIRTKRGSIINLEIASVPIQKQETISGVFIIARDITEKKHHDKRVVEIAFTDQLTGLSNRHFFYLELAKMVEKVKRQKGIIAVLSLDFDGFKDLNDTMGHTAGDLFLVKSAERLVACVGKKDCVYRVGGDEFAVIFECITKDDVRNLAQRIVKDLSQPYPILDTEVVVTVSIGISMTTNKQADHETLIQHSDLALLTAKRTGKNNFQFFTEELIEQARRKARNEIALRKAIENQELILHYQPQVDMHTEKLVGVEALLRWNPSFGPISPDEFIPIAESTGLIIPIGEWVIKEVCRQIKQWEQQGFPPVCVSVNVSASQLRERHFTRKVKKILAEENVDPALIEIEITETVMVDLEKSLKVINELKEIGFKIAIDDFGTGYSSLSLLSNVDFNTLKIDKSLIDDIHNQRKMAIVNAVIGVKKGLNTQIIIEGIETEGQVNYLKEHRVIAQGYYYSRPLPREELEKLILNKWVDDSPV